MPQSRTASPVLTTPSKPLSKLFCLAQERTTRVSVQETLTYSGESTTRTPPLPTSAPTAYEIKHKGEPTATITEVANMAGQIQGLKQLAKQLQSDLAAPMAMVPTLVARPTPQSSTSHPPPTPPPPPPPPQRTRGPPTPTRKAPSPSKKPSFSAITETNKTTATWQTVTYKAVKQAPFIVLGYSKVNWEIMIELASSIPDTVTNDAILRAVNTVLVTAGIKILLASRTKSNNIQHTTSPTMSASKVEPCCKSIAFGLRPF